MAGDHRPVNVKNNQKSSYRILTKIPDAPEWLSDRAKEFHRIKDVLDKLPESRDDKVAELSASVKKGSYKVDPDKPSRKIIQESLIALFV